MNDRLATEIVFDILGYIYHDDKLNPSSDLYNYVFICRSWRAPAQKLLWRHVQLSHETSCRKFIEAASGNPSLAEFVKILQVRMMDIPNPTPESFAEALSLCTSLSELRLQLGKRTSFSPEVMVKLKSAPVSPVSLIIDDAASRDTSLLDVWPSVRHLYCYRRLNIPKAGTAGAASTPLYELHCNGRAEFPQIRSFLEPSFGSLEILGLDGIILTPTEVWQLLAIHGPTLRSLRLPLANPGYGPAISTFCTRLEEFVLRSSPSSVDLIVALPETVYHLQFSAYGALHSSCLDAIRTMAGLRLITSAKGFFVDEGLVDLCEAKGVAIRYIADLESRYYMNAEALIHTPNFPRPSRTLWTAF